MKKKENNKKRLRWKKIYYWQKYNGIKGDGERDRGFSLRYVFFSPTFHRLLYLRFRIVWLLNVPNAKCDLLLLLLLLMRVIYVRCLDDILLVVQWRISAKKYFCKLCLSCTAQRFSVRLDRDEGNEEVRERKKKETVQRETQDQLKQKRQFNRIVRDRTNHKHISHV